MTKRIAFIVELSQAQINAVYYALMTWNDYCTNEKRERVWSKKERMQLFESCNSDLNDLYHTGPEKSIEEIAIKVLNASTIVEIEENS